MITCFRRGRVSFLRSSPGYAASHALTRQLGTADASRLRGKVLSQTQCNNPASFPSTRASFTNNPNTMSGLVEKISNLVVGEQKPQIDPKDEVFVGSIDQGTTSSRFLIFDKNGEPVAVHQEEFSQIYPNPGLVNLSTTKLRSS